MMYYVDVFVSRLPKILATFEIRYISSWTVGPKCMLAISVPAAAPQRVTQNMCPDNHINIRKNVTHKQRNGQTQNYCFTLCHMNVVSILTTEICEPLCIILLKCFRRQKPTLIQRQTPTYFLYLIAWIIYVLPSCSCPQLLDHIFQQIYLARTVLSEMDI